MKILTKRYPLGSIPRQQTDGRYINETLNENIKLLAKNITKDMTYLGIITSSTLEVGTGKSVFAQQISEAYLEYVREFHNIDNKLSMKNLVFRPQDIIERSFEVPRYSVVICDEWEDSHYWSELGKTLRQFFRKCRQLNLFILVIIPNFFQLPMSYAISRSVFLVDVKFTGEFDRGYFSFYNFQKKKNLYIRGKKSQDYDIIKPNFTGRFVDGYVVDREEYLKEKMNDLLSQEDMEKKPEVTRRSILIELFIKLKNNLKGVTNLELAKGFGISEQTAYNWINTYKESLKGSYNTNNLDFEGSTKPKTPNLDPLLVYPKGGGDNLSTAKNDKGIDVPIPAVEK
ncbi:hypothetical protein LCGC14_0652140 [marine sediment metagenome]|uniref:Zona occludens toxin N-terminal domain-containing protein n=1 Tax=marine sediment metagenome TaxID=412755 RepID=A0A0F9THQ4_9ZZZZ